VIPVARRWVWFLGWPVRAGLLLLIAAYRMTLGQILGGSCRFHPSCSAYASLAIGNAGAVRGTALTVWRLLRCTPFSRGGVDYPPGPRRVWAYDGVIHREEASPSPVRREQGVPS